MHGAKEGLSRLRARATPKKRNQKGTKKEQKRPPSGTLERTLQERPACQTVGWSSWQTRSWQRQIRERPRQVPEFESSKVCMHVPHRLHANAWWTRDLGDPEPSTPSALSRTLSSVPKKELCEVLAGHVITLRQTVAETEPETRRLRNPQRW